jgi:hypothetical protein
MYAPGEWIDKEPRADGRPRRRQPFGMVRGAQFIPQDARDLRPSQSTHVPDHSPSKPVSEARSL